MHPTRAQVVPYGPAFIRTQLWSSPEASLNADKPAVPADAGKTPAGEAKKAEEKPFDYQLQRALDMIAGIALYNARVSN